jgi:hypothetical protein
MISEVADGLMKAETLMLVPIVIIDLFDDSRRFLGKRVFDPSCAVSAATFWAAEEEPLPCSGLHVMAPPPRAARGRPVPASGFLSGGKGKVYRMEGNSCAFS